MSGQIALVRPSRIVKRRSNYVESPIESDYDSSDEDASTEDDALKSLAKDLLKETEYSEVEYDVEYDIESDYYDVDGNHNRDVERENETTFPKVRAPKELVEKVVEQKTKGIENKESAISFLRRCNISKDWLDVLQFFLKNRDVFIPSAVQFLSELQREYREPNRVMDVVKSSQTIEATHFLRLKCIAQLHGRSGLEALPPRQLSTVLPRPKSNPQRKTASVKRTRPQVTDSSDDEEVQYLPIFNRSRLRVPRKNRVNYPSMSSTSQPKRRRLPSIPPLRSPIISSSSSDDSSNTDHDDEMTSSSSSIEIDVSPPPSPPVPSSNSLPLPSVSSSLNPTPSASSVEVVTNETNNVVAIIANYDTDEVSEEGAGNDHESDDDIYLPPFSSEATTRTQFDRRNAEMEAELEINVSAAESGIIDQDVANNEENGDRVVPSGERVLFDDDDDDSNSAPTGVDIEAAIQALTNAFDERSFRQNESNAPTPSIETASGPRVSNETVEPSTSNAQVMPTNSVMTKIIEVGDKLVSITTTQVVQVISKVKGEESKCVICKWEPATHLASSCGHLCCCPQCLSTLLISQKNGSLCPVCRRSTSFVKFYRP